MLAELVEKRKRLHEENVALIKRARDAGRDVLNGDEESEWTQRDAALEAVSRQIERLEKQDAIEKRLAEVDDRKALPSSPSAQPPNGGGHATAALRSLQRSQDDLDLAIRGWMLRGRARPEHVEAARRANIPLDADLMTIWFSRRAPRTVAEIATLEFRALDSLTIPTGLALVPDEMMRSLERALLWYGGMRQAATTIRTSTGADLPWPMNNDTGNKGRIVGQNQPVVQTDTTFTQMVLKSFKYSSDEILVSVELMQDNAVNLPAVLGEMLGERIGRIQNEHFTIGTGTTMPWGIATRAAAGVTGAAGGGITYQNLVDLEHSVDIAYRRQGAAFMMADLKVAYFKKILDTTGRPIWAPGDQGIALAPIGGTATLPGTLLGYPVIVNNDLSSASTTGTRSVLFGALQKYIIRDVMGIELLRLNELHAQNHQVAFLAFTRADGDLLNAGVAPVKYFAHTT